LARARRLSRAGHLSAYNLAVWPAQIALLALALAIVAAVLLRREQAGRFVSIGLAALWAWVALAYHLAFFRHINPAAWLFAAIARLHGLVDAGVRADRISRDRALGGRAVPGLAHVRAALSDHSVHRRDPVAG
jgi:hypothetical protein